MQLRPFIWLINENGGAYAVISSNIEAIRYYIELINHGMYMALFHDYRYFVNEVGPWPKNLRDISGLITEGTATKTGQMINVGKMYQSHFGYGDHGKKMYHNMMFLLFGDPESEVVLHEPIDISYNVNHPAQIEAGTISTFSVSLKQSINIDLNRNPLRVSLYSEELDIRAVGHMGQIGPIFMLSPQTTGEIQVTITGFGIRPFRGKIMVVDEINPCDLYIINTKFDNVHEASAQRNIYAAPNVLVESPADVTFVAGKNIYLYPGFKAKAETGKLFRAFIDQGLYDPECD